MGWDCCAPVPIHAPTPLIAAARKRLQEMGPGALNRLEDLSNQTKHKTVAKKAKRVVGKYKGVRSEWDTSKRGTSVCAL